MIRCIATKQNNILHLMCCVVRMMVYSDELRMKNFRRRSSLLKIQHFPSTARTSEVMLIPLGFVRFGAKLRKVQYIYSWI